MFSVSSLENNSLDLTHWTINPQGHILNFTYADKSQIQFSAQVTNQCLDFSNNVSIQPFNGNKYIFNDVSYDSYDKIAVKLGDYTLYNVPQNHPIGFVVSDDVISVTSGTYIGTKTVEGIDVKHYYGTVSFSVLKMFTSLSYHCLYHGYMGGEYRLIFSSECTPANPPPTPTMTPTATPTMTPTPTPTVAVEYKVFSRYNESTKNVDIYGISEVDGQFWGAQLVVTGVAPSSWIESNNYTPTNQETGTDTTAQYIYSNANISSDYLNVTAGVEFKIVSLVVSSTGDQTLLFTQKGNIINKMQIRDSSGSLITIQDQSKFVGLQFTYDYTYNYTVTTPVFNYVFNGEGLNNVEQPADLGRKPGDKIVFNVNGTYGHPFGIVSEEGSTIQFVTNKITNGQLEFTVPDDGKNYKYRCENHLSMTGYIYEQS